ncbi:MAG TPA: ABC-2 transporter permease [Candidatus Ruania gallistercoris]|uniref:ABC-2 transporter permease n=1 Tax=Candidatus Ruania gallistercoris TaxID=2838746 RepID=A0A9D2EFD1_9MICO|nr:ABC-2 transporter permease [Candidatus Ruania gallistercoris]
MSTATLLLKESRLVVPPAYLGFAALTLFNLIPHYPMILGISYFMLALFIALSEANANKDHEFTISLPITRDSVVRAKHLTVVAVELIQLGALALVAVVAAQLNPEGSAVSLDGNFAFFGVVLVSLGLFNLVFLPGYFTTGYRTGRPGVLAGLVFFGSYAIAEVVVALVPPVKEVLDTLDPAMAGPQLLVLAAGALVYVGLTLVSYRLSVARFDRVNL